MDILGGWDQKLKLSNGKAECKKVLFRKFWKKIISMNKIECLWKKKSSFWNSISVSKQGNKNYKICKYLSQHEYNKV